VQFYFELFKVKSRISTVYYLKLYFYIMRACATNSSEFKDVCRKAISAGLPPCSSAVVWLVPLPPPAGDHAHAEWLGVSVD